MIVAGDASAAVDGDEVGTIGPGGFFGEMALIDGGERVATVTARRRCSCSCSTVTTSTRCSNWRCPDRPKLLAVVGARMRAIEEQTGVDATLGL